MEADMRGHVRRHVRMWHVGLESWIRSRTLRGGTQELRMCVGRWKLGLRMRWAARFSDADRPKATLGRDAQGPQGHIEGVVRKACKDQTACPRL